MDIRLHVLERITNNFSEDLRIGRGGYGDVYKGLLRDGKLIAVKLLHDPVQGLDDELFKNEVGNLLKVEHPNVVQFLGYCYETQSKYIEDNGANIFGKHIRKVLCFEYLKGGSLDKHLQELSLAPTWSTHYNIIKGICEGLNYLHGHVPQILHLDLKPANILVDSNMTPKLADFGLSRLFGGSHTHVTKNMRGTEKYMSPDSINEYAISPKNDIFSLGVVIIDIMAGPTGYSDFQEDVPNFMNELHTKWSNIIEHTSEWPSQQLLQVKTCIATAMRCVASERKNRPSMASIIDILNETETDIPNEQLAVVPLSRTIDIQNSFAETLKMMTAELDIREASSNVEETLMEDRETTSYVEEGLIIGRTKEKMKILSILSESSANEMVILPIYGIGGIGKTTLAQLVFNDIQFSKYSRVWIHVSEKLDLNKIGKSIIRQVSEKISNKASIQMVSNQLAMLLAGKSILIVLDDLWEENPGELDRLKAMLRLGKGRKVIIVTTRDEAIARKICNTVENVPYKLEILTDDMCWTIIKQKSDFKNQPHKKQLEQIGRDIAVKCGGVALAAQSLGYMLGDMPSDQWESVRDNDIWNSSPSEDPSLKTPEVLASLRLSYSRMHDFLKFCFSYCAVYPKGHTIVKCDLIYQWIALELTEPSKIFDSTQICERYITQLLGMSFLQYSIAPLDDARQDKVGTFFTMHDLVHDLARAIMADKVNKMDNDVGSSCQYALLTDPSKPLQSFTSFPENLKALHFLDCANIELHDGAISAAKYLVVLDLSGCFIQKLPDSIGQLKHLRYLNAPRIKDQIIPNCITELSKLNYLNLRYSQIRALPDSIGDVKGLMHLDLSGCESIRRLPASFGELKKLVHLDLSHCRMFIPEDLSGFTKLQHLNLSVEFALVAKPIKELPKVIGNLINLRYLNLSGCIRVMTPSKEEIDSLLGSISTLSNLEHLDMSQNWDISSLPESIGNLNKLHTLDLLGCNRIERLPKSMADMECLKVLNLKGRASRLEESALSQLNFATLPHFVVSRGERSSNLILLRRTNPDKLEVSGLENVMSTKEAQSIELVEKNSIEDLTFKWSKSAPMSLDDKEVLEKLVPPSSLRKWYIYGYRGDSIPDWMMGIGHYLPNLSRIDLSDFPKCSNLPAFGQLPNLEWLGLWNMESMEKWNITCSNGEVGANEHLFPKLKKLRIQDCQKLTIEPSLPRALSWTICNSDNVLSAWAEYASQPGASPSSSPLTNLELEVQYCNLPLRQWRLLHHLPAIRSLTIWSHIDLAAPPEIIHKLSSLQSLTFRNYKRKDDQAELPAWLIQLTSLQKLEVMHAKLDGLNEQARQLKQLQSLRLSYCTSITSQPQWLGELTSLKELRIQSCEGIRSLPDNISQLTKLETLYVMGFPELFQWCELDENRRKLAHIKDKYIKLLPAVRRQAEDFVEIQETSSPVAAMNLDTAGASRTKNTTDVVNNIAATTDDSVLIDEAREEKIYSDVMDDQGCVFWLRTFLNKLFN